MRVIAATRLSRLTDDTDSPERQAESLREYSKRNGHVIVDETSDLDVSGGKPIRKRPGVGPWLTRERLDEWDAIACYSIDRGFRDLYDFITFWHDFLKPNGKSIIITSENIDMSTPDGVMMAQMRVMMAENELNKISKRNKDAADWAREHGLWKGGQIPWGYMPVREGNHWILQPDPAKADLINQIASDIIAGKSVADVARELTKLKVSTGRRLANGEPRTYWRPGPLIRTLRMETLKGYIPFNHKLVERDGKKRTVYEFVREVDGELMRREPVLKDDKWALLQEALKRPAQAVRGKRHDASPLLHIAQCMSCGAWMHHNAFTSRGTRYRYYTCNSQDNGCKERSVNADQLEAWLDNVFTNVLGDGGMIQHFTKPGTDHREAIERVKFQRANLDQDADDCDERYAELGRELKRLRGLPVTEPVSEDRPALNPDGSPLMLRDFWAGLDAAGRRAHLLRAGVTMAARRRPDGTLEAGILGEPTLMMMMALSRKGA